MTRWAIHPGGRGSSTSSRTVSRLDEHAVEASRAVLADHGNCSSATVLLIVGRILAADDMEAGDPVVVMAFGPGLTIYAALLLAR